MKYIKNVFIIIVFSILIGCAAKKEIVEESVLPPSPLPQGTYFWAVKPQINIRADNTTAAPKLGQMKDGDSVLVLQNKDGWYQVLLDDQTNGWIRSDLLGPKHVSVFAKAVQFVDSIKASADIDLFFDKKLLHRRIYLQYPDQMYGSRTMVEQKTKELVNDYQQKVYRGDVTVRVIKPQSQDEFLTLDIKGTINPSVILPVLPFGILSDINISQPEQIKLTISITDSVDNEALLTNARNLVSVYPISYSQVEIVYVSDSADCLLWYMEDAGGELYEFNRCAK